LTIDETIEIPIQINGKNRAKINVPQDISEDELEQAARNEPRMAELLEGKQIVKTVVVLGRLVNFVVK
jgi:leucyl-tRNA synthetase